MAAGLHASNILQTSIYGMTNMPTDHNFLPFAATTIGICIPTYLLILLVNNPDNVRNILSNFGLFFTKLTSCAVPEKSEKMKEKLLDFKLPHNPNALVVRKPATYASLEARLSRDLMLEPTIPHHPSEGFIQATTRRLSQTISSHLPGTGRRASKATIQPPNNLPTYAEEMTDVVVQRHRSSTIKFEEPFNNPARWRLGEMDSDKERDPQYGATRWRTGELEGPALRELESTSSISPKSPETSAGPNPANGAIVSAGPPTETVTGVAEAMRQRRMSAPRSWSLFGRLGERFSPLQPTPRTPESGSLSPNESV